jgi:hypothetical protein
MRKIYWFLLAIVLIGALYWTQYRPYRIVKDCRNDSLRTAVLTVDMRLESDTTKRQFLQDEYKAKLFDQCVKEHGMSS